MPYLQPKAKPVINTLSEGAIIMKRCILLGISFTLLLGLIAFAAIPEDAATEKTVSDIIVSDNANT